MAANTIRKPHASTVGRRDFVKMAVGTGVWSAALLTRTAQAQGQPGRPNSIDVHAHWEPPAYAKAVAALRSGSGGGEGNPLNADLNERVKWMDEFGVQMNALSLAAGPSGMAWEWAAPNEAARLAQIFNDASIEGHQAFPDRFIVGAVLPVGAPALALQELNRVAGRPGVRAVALPLSFGNRDFLFEPDFAPVLARIEELGYPILFHPLSPRTSNPRWEGDGWLSNSVGFPVDGATTAAMFITTGTLDKYPNLDIVLSHSGGAFPYVAGRIEHGFLRRDFKTARPFREYIRRFHYDTLTYYPETMRFLIDLVGTDRVVIGTDNFAPMDTTAGTVDNPHTLVEAMNLPAADRELIMRGNATRLFKL
jgi:aminocarboxymuconate-semialdehyde decarboxylase